MTLDTSPIPEKIRTELKKCQQKGIVQAVVDCEKLVMSLRSEILNKLDELKTEVHDESIQSDVDDE